MAGAVAYAYKGRDGAGKVVKGKVAAVHPLLWVIGVLFVIYFAIDPISRWIS